MRRAFLIAGVLVLASACGNGSSDDPAVQPSPDVTTFADGDFAGIPLPPLGEEAGQRSEEDGIVTQSFFVRNRTPEAVLDFYADYFRSQDIDVITPPRSVGGATWRGWWFVDGRELLVTALPASATGGAETERADVVTQMSLELWPPGSADEHVPAVKR
jgi:hypothetical protein